MVPAHKRHKQAWFNDGWSPVGPTGSARLEKTSWRTRPCLRRGFEETRAAKTRRARAHRDPHRPDTLRAARRAGPDEQSTSKILGAPSSDAHRRASARGPHVPRPTCTSVVSEKGTPTADRRHHLSLLDLLGTYRIRSRHTESSRRTARHDQHDHPFQIRELRPPSPWCPATVAKTVTSSTTLLGMKLVELLQAAGRQQHFFLDMGNGVDGIAFFWFPDAPEGVRGESTAGPQRHDGDRHGEPHRVRRPGREDGRVPEKLKSKGVEVTQIINHSDSLDGGHQPNYDPATDEGDVFIRSMYFQDPNGTLLEFACWTRPFDESDVKHAPATAAGAPVNA